MRHVGRLLDGNVGSRPAELVKDGDLNLLIGRILDCANETLFVFPRSRGMLLRAWFGKVGFVSWIAQETMQLMRRLILVVGGLIWR